MAYVRVIGRLDIKGPNLIKGVHMEGLRVVGDPQLFAQRYYEQGVDELFYQDLVASLYGRNHLGDIVRRATEKIFIPITVAGGIRSVSDARELLRCGADKIAINTQAIKRPSLIREVAEEFGSQCMVLSVEAKRSAGVFEPYTDMGREATGMNVVEWVQEAEELGAGEIIITSIDRDGTQKGFDLELVRAVTQAVSIPVIASGGLGKPDDLVAVVKESSVSAVAVGAALHFQKCTLRELKQVGISAGLAIRSSQSGSEPRVAV